MSDQRQKLTVAVTGASGFIGTHVVRELLERGHTVHASVRDATKLERVSHLTKLHENIPGAVPVKLFSADLTGSVEAFVAAFTGCDAVCHVAAVVKMTSPNPEKEIIQPTVNGARTVLNAIDKVPTVRTVVLMSSVAAIMKTKYQPGHIYTEADWGDDATLKSNPYGLSKYAAEKEFWKYIDNLPEERKIRLVCINPVAVMGPILAPVHAQSSIEIMKRLINGEFPGYPGFSFGIIDVRDVAKATVEGVERDELKGRFILHESLRWMKELADFAREEFKPPQYKLPTCKLPNFLLYLGAIFDKDLSWAFLNNNLDKPVDFNNSRVTKEMGLNLIPAKESALASCRSLVELGIVKPRK